MAAAMEEQDSPLYEHFTDLRYETVEAVCVNISVESPRRKMDWRALASVLGFSEKQVQLMHQDGREPCKGRLLVRVWEDLGKSSLLNFIYALKEANIGESLKVIMEDPDLEEIDFKKVLQDYEHLKANHLLRKEFPRILMSKFSAVFYPSINMIERPATYSDDPNVLIEVDPKNLSSLPGQTHSANQTILEERSVYISYYPESGLTSRTFNKQLKRLAELIQNQGFTLYFEPNCQSQIRSHGGVVMWKEACIKKSKHILVICTPEYCNDDVRRINNRKSDSKLDVDSSLIKQLAYGGESNRIIPVILEAKKPGRCQIPSYLAPLVTYSFPSGETNLLHCLDNVPRYVLPKFDPSKRRVLKPKVIDYPNARKHKC